MIKGSVGKKGDNNKEDIVLVQLLLNKFIIAGRLALPALVVDRVCGKKTIVAIKTFQAVFLGFKNPDGKVSAPGPTLTALTGDINQPQKGDPSESSRQAVLETLDGLLGFQFMMNGISIAKSDFTEIAKLVRWRSIEIAYDPLKGDNAEYFHNGNAMFIGFQTSGSAFRRSIVVHESVHAILDKRGSPQTVLLSEAAAFIAQCVYYYKATGRYIHEVSYKPTADVLARASSRLQPAVRNLRLQRHLKAW